MSGFSMKMYGDVCYYYNSFVGCDFKAWFIYSEPILRSREEEVLLNCSKISF